MSTHDVLVVGGGISGLAFAHHAARSGRSVLVLERDTPAGGCLSTHRGSDGYWFELGAHTCYNSYVGLVDLVDACGLRGEVVPRAKTRLRFLDGDRLVPGSNLAVLLRLFSWGELLVHLPRMRGATKEGQTVASYYSRIVGPRNYAGVLGPMLSAVPSQDAGGFPAGMLFKSRGQRRKDYPRSFTLRGGLRTLAEGLSRQKGVEVVTGQAASRVERTGEGFAVTTESGARHEARVLALAAGPSVTARLLAAVAPALSRQAGRVGEASVETLGFAVRAEMVSLPVSMFLIPRADTFRSIVTRDSVPDAAWRAFAFHFGPGQSAEAKLARASRLLKLGRSDLAEVAERQAVLPSPALGHEEIVQEVDRLSQGLPIALLGNWFAGLSLEDCVDRSASEWARLEAMDRR